MKKVMLIPAGAKVAVNQEGEIRVLADGQQPKENEVVYSEQDFALLANDDIRIVSDTPTTSSDDIQSVQNLIDLGQDPTQQESLDPTAGQNKGSAPTLSPQVARDNQTTIAETFFDTNANDQPSDRPSLLALSDETNSGIELAAIIGGNDSGAVTEDATSPLLIDSGKLTIEDNNKRDANFDPNNIVTPRDALGTLTIDTQGNWTYSVNNESVQYLAQDETKVETFTVASVDGTTHDIVITITGVNDSAVISGDAIGAVTEDDTDPVLTDSGVLTLTDADSGEAKFDPTSVVTPAGALGALTIDADGNWVYNVDNADVQYLAQNETKIETFTVASVDGTTHDIVITITGINDSAVISGDAIGAVTEDDTDPVLTDSGVLTLTDADTGEAKFDPTSVVTPAGALGELTIDADGNWVYNVDNADVQYLAQNETKVETFTVASVDGTTHDIVITITGVNDSAVISGDATGAVTEDDTDPVLTDSGVLTLTDADTGEAKFDPTSVVTPAGALGALTIDADGNWVYNVDNADVQYLAQDETKVETFTVASVDGTSNDIVITITGVNDSAVISGDAIGAVTEDDTDPVLTDSGVLTLTDADTGEAKFDPASVVTPAGALGELTIDADGNWVYNVDNADVQYLAQDETKVETFTVASVDGTTHDIVITITGINDSAVISGDAIGAVTEDETNPVLTDSGVLTLTDADTGEAKFDPTSVVTPADALGELTIDADGNWVYNVDNADVQYLAQDETKVETFTVASVDGTTHDIVITITGVNDSAVISGDAIGAVTEDDTDPVLTDSGVLTLTDADTGEAKFDPASVVTPAGALGALTIDADGNWVYNVDNADVQYLAQDETKVETFTVGSVDGTTHDIVITITGVNDSAVISGDAVGAVTEDETDPVLTDSGVLTLTDADTGEAKFDPTSVVTPADALGELTIDADGNWVYNVNNANVQYLAQDETKVETFTVASVDGTTHEIVITITGVNDSAVISGDAIGAVTEDETNPVLTDSGVLTLTDADTDQAKFDPTSVVTPDGALGSLTIDENGNWVYNVDNADVQYLAQNETKVETFTVASVDGTTHDIVITITGINDSAVISGDAIGAVTEDYTNPVLTDSGVLTLTDADSGEAKFDPTSVITPAGALGALTIDADGNWVYNVDNADVQYLTQDETKVETFTVASVDGTMHDIVITITGINDSAVISGDAVGAVTEDETDPVLTDSGVLTLTDADTGEAKFDPASVVTPTVALGALTIDADGNWVYNVDNADVQYLAQDETKVETFTVASVDGTTHDIVITITGVNDSAVISGDAIGAVTEDDTNPVLTDSGVLTLTDADTGEAKFDPTSVITPAGALGALTIDADGNWVYNVDNADVQYLAQDETKVETFTVASVDGTTHDIVITITGVNDSAVISGDAIGAVTEDATDPVLTDSGVLTLTDADTGEAKFDPASVVTPAGALGALTIDADGNWVYNVDNADVQYLAQDETKVETFTVASVDGTTHDIIITITGVNDSAVISGDAIGSVTEDDTDPVLTDSGVLTLTDADTGEAKFDPTSVVTPAGALGELTIDENGNWVYNVDNADVQYLAQDETKVETFTVASVDGTTHDIVITITGINDSAVISGDAVGAVTEDETDPVLTDSGVLTLTDADTGEAKFDPASVVTPTSALGALTIDADGNWVYNVDNADVQYLAQDETKVETFTVASVDGTTHDIVITITGVNDSAVISGDAIGAVTEDDTNPVLTDSGVLTLTDADTGEAKFDPTSVITPAGALGALTIDADSNWVYNVDNADVQYLAQDETKVETFTVASVDGTTHDIVITITGVNDSAVISGDAIGAVTEDATDPVLTDSGVLTLTDADTGEAKFDPTSVATPAGALGVLTIDADGNWVYNVDNADVQYLAQDETKVETFTVASVDGTTHDIVITITGVNDSAVISGDAIGSVTEDDTDPVLTDSGVLTLTDADSGEAKFDPASVVTPAGALGALTIDADGNWVYNVDNADVQYLAQDETKVETFTVASVDGTTHDIVITITGINDSAVISGDAIGAVTEDDTDPVLTDSGILTLTDADTDQAKFDPTSVATPAGALGVLTIDADGNWVYNVDNADVQYLAQDETKVETFTVASVDGTTHDIVITITGVNDSAVISGDAIGAVTEDDTDPVLTDSGVLTLTDADTDQAKFDPTSVITPAGALGSLTIDADGNWVYNVDNADVQYLSQDETKVETFTVASVDGTTHDIVITITGVNDSAVISGDAIGAVTEDDSNPVLTDSGVLTLTDADTGEAKFDPTSVVTPAGALGALTIDADGNWVYNVDNADVQYLAQDETKVETFTVASVDGTTHDIVITITGVNDSAVISGDAIGAVTEDDTDPLLTDSGVLTLTDADTGEAKFDPTSVVTPAGALGELTIDENGNWVYNVDNADVQYLAQDETKVETFTVASVDGTTHDIVITITGINDSAVISGDAIGAVTEDDTDPVLTDSGVLTLTDADTGEAKFDPTSVVTPAGALGELTIDADGNWVYNVDNADVQYLAQDETKVETFTVASVDGTTHDIVITITGVNDSAVISGDAIGAVTEDDTDPVLTDSGVLTLTDADTGEAKFDPASVVTPAGALGALTIDADGNWVYNVDNADVQYLAQDETKVETFTVASVDGTTHDIVITITGVNDSAVISGDAIGAVTEDDTNPVLTDSGVLTLTDADTGEAKFDPTSVVTPAGAFGELTIDENGNWVYNVDNADVQYLAQDETKVETFTVASVDGTTHDIVITITGVNDSAVISGDAIGAVTEDDTDPVLTDSGVLTLTDADTDTDEAKFDPASVVTPAGALGALTIDADGNWDYQVDNADVQYLKAGETKQEVFSVSSIDGTTHDITVTINGINEIPDAMNDSKVTQDPRIRLDEAPDYGTMQYNVDNQGWQDMVVGEEYDANAQVRFVPDEATIQTMTRDIKVGSFDANPNTPEFNGPISTSHWGTVSGKSAVFEENGTTITTKSSSGPLTAYNTYGHLGSGIGDNDNSGLSQGEKLSITIDGEDINEVTFRLSGLGSYFDETSPNATKVKITAFDENGDLIDTQSGYRQSGSYEDYYSFTTDRPVKTFELTTSGSNGTYVVQNMVISKTLADDFILTTIQADNSETPNHVALDLNYDDADVTLDMSDKKLIDNDITKGELYVEESETLIISASALLENDSDIDGGTLSITSVQNAIGGTVLINGSGDIEFTASSTFTGKATFEYTLSDAQGGSDTAIVSINVGATDNTYSWSSDTVGTDDDPGSAVIDTFDSSQDIIDLRGFVAASSVWSSTDVAQNVQFTEVDGNTQISLLDNNDELVQSITLDGIAINDFTGTNTAGMSDAEVLSHLVSEEKLLISDTYGHEGDDVLSGTPGDDVFRSGMGNDTFRILDENAGRSTNPTTDTIMNFNVNNDVIDLSDLLPDSPTTQDLLDHIEVEINDDINDLTDTPTTTLAVTDENGGVSKVVMNNVGWNELGINDVAASQETIIAKLVDQLNVVNVDG
ncbi:VCBS domain-containing protein [Vibrio scophthalmi]|uniref:VCBS domain-containing protein n=1 Tax=Vibrio scophthalmi TaxID=45658 RepID=UPI003EB88D71